jgi:hypothetical protein
MRRMAKSAPKRAKPKRRKPCIAKAGTALAIIGTDMSEAHVDAKPCFLKHGGARNSKRSTSDVLTLAKAQATIAAAYQAIKIGLPFNRFVTVHFERAGIADAEALAATGDMMKLATDWMRKRGHVIAYAWVRENDTGDGTKDCYASAPHAYLQNLDRVLAYMVKGVLPADAITLGLPKQEAGGHIIDKRAGWSQNIGMKSRVLTP